MATGAGREAERRRSCGVLELCFVLLGDVAQTWQPPELRFKVSDEADTRPTNTSG